MGLVAIVCGLLLAEPDFGATVVMLLITMSVLFLAGAQLKHFFTLCVAVGALLAASIGYLYVSHGGELMGHRLIEALVERRRQA